MSQGGKVLSLTHLSDSNLVLFFPISLRGDSKYWKVQICITTHCCLATLQLIYRVKQVHAQLRQNLKWTSNIHESSYILRASDALMKNVHFSYFYELFVNTFLQTKVPSINVTALNTDFSQVTAPTKNIVIVIVTHLQTF